MTVNDLNAALDGKILCAREHAGRTISGGFACDLLSHVMANAREGNAWFTILTHMNTVAVAVLNDLACIVIPHGVHAEERTLLKAEEEGVPVITTSFSTYEGCIRMQAFMHGGSF
ncbi:MAG: DRTGG domain-containing protein [Clostridia bacterium]